jgi:hypothetical protein
MNIERYKFERHPFLLEIYKLEFYRTRALSFSDKAL